MKETQQYRDWLQSWPLTRQRFLGWMIERYGTTEKYFFTAPKIEQYRAVSHMLGYSSKFSDDWDLTNMFSKVSEYLYIYENLLNLVMAGKLPEDPIKTIGSMDYNKRDEVFPQMHEPSKIYTPSLNAAIVDYVRDFTIRFEKDKIFIVPSLNKAIIDLAEPVPAPLEDMDAFWQQLINESHMYASGELVCPF